MDSCPVFPFYIYHRAWTRKTAVVLVLPSACQVLAVSSALKYLSYKTSKDFKNKLFALSASKNIQETILLNQEFR